MGPGGCRPSHPSAKNQITPTSRLVNRQANHLLQNLVPLPQSCEGPSECNEATRLGLPYEGMPPQCNEGLFTGRLADPQSLKDGRQLACPPLTSGGLALEGVTCRECGDALNLQYSFLIKLASLSGKSGTFFLLMDVEKKIGLKGPKLHTQGPPSTCQGGLREYASPPKMAKNRRILILRAHVSPHLGPRWSSP